MAPHPKYTKEELEQMRYTKEQLQQMLADLDKNDHDQTAVDELVIEDGKFRYHVRGPVVARIVDGLMAAEPGESKSAQGKQADKRTSKPAGQQDDEPRRGEEGKSSVWDRRRDRADD
jgi:hypothetical protein